LQSFLMRILRMLFFTPQSMTMIYSKPAAIIQDLLEGKEGAEHDARHFLREVADELTPAGEDPRRTSSSRCAARPGVPSAG